MSRRADQRAAVAVLRLVGRMIDLGSWAWRRAIWTDMSIHSEFSQNLLEDLMTSLGFVK
jgi:hypothetical protein